MPARATIERKIERIEPEDRRLHAPLLEQIAQVAFDGGNVPRFNTA